MKRKRKFGSKITNDLYHYARLSNDITTYLSGDYVKILRRLKNKMIGRLFIRKFW